MICPGVCPFFAILPPFSFQNITQLLVTFSGGTSSHFAGCQHFSGVIISIIHDFNLNTINPK
jgi:hypothetical protein